MLTKFSEIQVLQPAPAIHCPAAPDHNRLTACTAMCTAAARLGRDKNKEIPRKCRAETSHHTRLGRQRFPVLAEQKNRLLCMAGSFAPALPRSAQQLSTLDKMATPE